MNLEFNNNIIKNIINMNFLFLNMNINKRKNLIKKIQPIHRWVFSSFGKIGLFKQLRKENLIKEDDFSIFLKLLLEGF